MTIVRRPSPFGELLTLRQAMDRLFDDLPTRSGFSTLWSETGTLALDITSTPEALVIEAAMPGVAPEDVEITVEGGSLTISGQYRRERSEGEGDYLLRELRHGSFSRVVALPDGLEPDRASATFEHGMLELRVPKAEATKPRQIRITPAVTTDAAPLTGGSAEASPTTTEPA